MAFQALTTFKEVFMGANSFLIQKTPITEFTLFNPDMEIPVTVDSMNLTQAEPTINRVKVHGLQTDWASSATPGDITFAATIPSIEENLVQFFMGESNKITNATITIGDQSYTGTGFSTSINMHRLNVSLGVMDDSRKKLIIIKNLTIYASPLFENASTTPFAFRLTGTIEASDGSGADDDNIGFYEITKKAS